MKRSLTLFFVLLFYVSFSFSQQEKLKVKGDIKLEKQDGLLLLRAQVVNEEQFFIDELEYNLFALKKSANGNLSNNKQSGDFTLAPNEEKYLSTLRINLGAEDKLESFLFIKYKGKLIHRDTLFINVKKGKKVNQQQRVVNNELDYRIKGIVIDEALTRMGKDFHDFFYTEYVVSNRKYPYIIKIKERPAMGRSSIIFVEVEGNKVHEFLARPEEDYLKQNVAMTMRLLTNYQKTRLAIKNRRM